MRAELPPMDTTKICLRFVINSIELYTIDNGHMNEVAEVLKMTMAVTKTLLWP